MDYTSARVVLSLRSDVIRSHQPDLFQGQVSGDLQLRDRSTTLSFRSKAAVVLTFYLKTHEKSGQPPQKLSPLKLCIYRYLQIKFRPAEAKAKGIEDLSSIYSKLWKRIELVSEPKLKDVTNSFIRVFSESRKNELQLDFNSSSRDN